MSIDIRIMRKTDVLLMKQALQKHTEYRGKNYPDICWNENQKKSRVTVIALAGNECAGYAHLLFESKYPHFKNNDIPEINDVMVFSPYRKNGVGTGLVKKLEEIAFAKYPHIGLGVGLYAAYGAAQKLYVNLGYVPDGNGIQYGYRTVDAGTTVPIDDDPLLFFMKKRVIENQ